MENESKNIENFAQEESVEQKAILEKLKKEEAKRLEEEELQQKLEELKRRATMHRNFIWGIFFAVSFVFAILLALVLMLLNLSSTTALTVSFVSFLVFIVITIVNGYFETPHKHEDIIECLGEYVGEVYKPGPHIIFPYFKLEKIACRVYMGEQRLSLYLNKDTPAGDVEFMDCSASLRADLFFRIEDARKANYEIGDVIVSIREKAEHILRSFFGSLRIDEAIDIKGFFRLNNVVVLVDKSVDFRDKDGKLQVEKFKAFKPSDEEASESSFAETLESWGAKAISFIISDIDLPDNVKEQRARLLAAMKDLEVADVKIKTSRKEAKIKVIGAEAIAKESKIIGQGEADKIENLKKSGVEDQPALDYLINKEKWNAVSKNPNATVIIGDGSKSSEGAQIGAGIGAATKKEKK
ncbi:MAG: SPFH domain-containing protein [Patescibacteria group bacterium]|jgi:regulator of protease activity HflC (stomatin/prohibitin superfamily)|nr:SPFH domain-containing protein [bacterium]HQC49576.1 SPFH domain-containing protein [bacterium]